MSYLPVTFLPSIKGLTRPRSLGTRGTGKELKKVEMWLQFSVIPIHKLHPPSNLPNTCPQTNFVTYTDHHFPDSIHIFTDGSKNEEGVGAAYWISALSFSSSFSLPSFTSIFHAEQTAIFQALIYIRHNFNYGNFLIITDSLSALQSLSVPSNHCKTTLALSIISLIVSLSPININFLWVAGHSGIINNEIVDTKAKAARTSSNTVKLLPSSELFSLIRRSTIDDWAHQYSSSFNNPNSFYLHIQPQLPPFPWYELFSDTRRDLIVKLSRPCFGHNRLPPHLKRINLANSDSCPLHPDTPAQANLNHLFFQCPTLLNIRQSLTHSPLSLQSSLIHPLSC